MDPVTALGVATTAFNTIKKGFSIGKDAQSMMSDVGKWMSAIESVKNPPDKKSSGLKFSVLMGLIEKCLTNI